jgi:hypothetical protein
MNNSAGAVDLSQNPWRKTWVHSQHGHWVPSSSSSLCSRNRPSVCSQLTTHNTAAGSGHQTAHPYTSTPSTPPISFRKLMIRTAGSGRKTVVNITWLPAIRHRSWETASLTMLTTYHHTVTYIIAWPAHTIYSWRFGITVGAWLYCFQSIWSVTAYDSEEVHTFAFECLFHPSSQSSLVLVVLIVP